MDKPPLSTPVQMAIGAAAALLAYLVMGGLVILGVPIGTAGWLIVFAVIWALVFVTLRKRMFSLAVSFLIVEFTIYFVLAARGFRLWW